MAFGNKLKVTGQNLGFWILVLSFAFGATIFVLPSCAENIKEPNVAGIFYPSEKSALSQMIRKYLRAAGQAAFQGKPVVLISPHAGIVYSGPVAAYGFNALSGKSFDTVVILAATHWFSYRGASVYREGFFHTPLGDLEVDNVLASELMAQDKTLLFFEPKYFEQEHSLEVQFPFMQESFEPGFKILPILLGEMSYGECLSLAKYLAKITVGRNVLVIASTDLSHYRTYAQALIYDTKTISFIKLLDAKGLWDAVAQTGWNVCGIRPVVTGLHYAALKGAESVELSKYANSADTAGNKDKVVGYVSVLITKGGALSSREAKKEEVSMFTKEEKKRLLGIARQTIQAHVRGEKPLVFKEDNHALNVRHGAFVTLHKNGQLRGCIGLFTSDEPLYKVISQMALASSTSDYRFPRVTPDELSDIVIEISVLSEPKLIDDWRNIRLGTDGVIIRKGSSSGIFLPQVATQTLWDLETFLGELCSQKAGLPRDSYKDPGTKIYTFQAEIFSEDEI